MPIPLRTASPPQISPPPPDADRAWWKEAAIYQIYPSSFRDTTGSGTGDLPGIISKLDYLHDLGIDIVWLSPVYKSPQVDMGYDISDYCAIDPRYGSVADIVTLVEGLKARGMKLMMDLVVNHTSDQHDWFIESASSKTNPKRDWYIWRPAKYSPDGTRHPPNNWASVFGGSAWKWHPETGEYFLHLFTPSQPDLNWENPAVRHAVHEAMHFWLRLGVSGFRMDVINLISKPPSLPDAPVTAPGEKWQPGMGLYANGPRLHEFLREMRTEVLSKYDVVTVGEMPWVSEPKEVLKAVGRERGELDMVFQFDLVDIDILPPQKFTRYQPPLKTIKSTINKWQTALQQPSGWSALFLENHDQPRSVSRFGSDSPAQRAASAKMLATWYALMQGTVYVYQGQEIGMANVPKEWGMEEYKDIETQNYWEEVLEANGGKETGLEDVKEVIRFRARDNGRTPMQWNTTPNAGFTTGTPWMRTNPDYPHWNAATQLFDPSSVHSYWRALLTLRKEHKETFIYGAFEMLAVEHKTVFAYRRGAGAVVVLNFSGGPAEWNAVKEKVALGTEKMGNYGGVSVKGGIVRLRPWECVVFLG